jgi:hypothetical protein
MMTVAFGVAGWVIYVKDYVVAVICAIFALLLRPAARKFPMRQA